MSPAATKKLAAVVALLVGVGAIAYLSLGSLEENIVYYWTPQDLLAKGNQVTGSTLRLGGMVQKDSVKWDAEALRLRFELGDKPEPGGPAVVVVSNGAPPQMFREGIGCIVEGRYDGSVFRSDRVMVKHSNEYQAPKEGEDPRQLYKTLMPGRMPERMRAQIEQLEEKPSPTGMEGTPSPVAAPDPAPGPETSPTVEPSPTAPAAPNPAPPLTPTATGESP